MICITAKTQVGSNIHTLKVYELPSKQHQGPALTGKEKQLDPEYAESECAE